MATQARIASDRPHVAAPRAATSEAEPTIPRCRCALPGGEHVRSQADVAARSREREPGADT